MSSMSVSVCHFSLDMRWSWQCDLCCTLGLTQNTKAVSLTAISSRHWQGQPSSLMHVQQKSQFRSHQASASPRLSPLNCYESRQLCNGNGPPIKTLLFFIRAAIRDPFPDTRRETLSHSHTNTAQGRNTHISKWNFHPARWIWAPSHTQTHTHLTCKLWAWEPSDWALMEIYSPHSKA